MNTSIRRMRLLDILLRIEIGLPFALLEMPVSLMVGMVFAIANYLGEIAYKRRPRAWPAFMVLFVNALVNAVALGIGLFSIGHLQLRVHGQDVVDIARIKAIALLFIVFGVAMVLIRAMLLLVDIYLTGHIEDTDQR